MLQGGGAVVTKQSWTGGGEHPGGSTYSMRVAGTGASTNLGVGIPVPYSVTQKNEGQVLTLSGFIRFSSASWSVNPGTVRIRLGYTTSTPDQTFSANDYAAAGVVEQIFAQGSLPTSWKKFIVNIKVPAPTNLVAEVVAATAAYGAGDWYELSQFQLETGANATPYQYSAGSYNDEAVVAGVADDTKPLGYTDDPTVVATIVKSQDTTILDSDPQRVWYMITGSGKRTVTLPAAANNNMKIIEIIKKDSDIGYVEIVSPSTIYGEDVINSNTYHVPAQYEGVILQSDASKWVIKGLVNVENLVGTVIAFGGITPPSGYLMCDGGSYDNTGKYTRLFNKIGYSHGGSGSNFNAPDTRDKFIRGAHAGGRVPGQAEGDSTKLPNAGLSGSASGGGHQHHYFDSGVAVDTGNQLSNGSDRNVIYPSDNTRTTNVDDGAGAHSHSVSVSGGDAETRPANVAEHYIIKY